MPYQVFTSKQEGVSCIHNLDNYVTRRNQNTLLNSTNLKCVLFSIHCLQHPNLALFLSRGSQTASHGRAKDGKNNKQFEANSLEIGSGMPKKLGKQYFFLFCLFSFSFSISILCVLWSFQPVKFSVGLHSGVVSYTAGRGMTTYQ